MWRKTAIWFVSTLAFSATARAVESDVHAPVKPPCLAANETREEIKSHHLIEPFAALKSAQAQFKAEPLSAKLCRQADDFVYVISMLHRDGRYIHVTMNAVSGKFVETRHAHEAPQKP